MTSVDIFNQSLSAANSVAQFLLDKKFTPAEIVGALLINLTSIEHGGKPIDEELVKNLVHDFITIRNTQDGS